jgi:hypothetical protein
MSTSILRKFIKNVILEAKIEASPEYMKKEMVMQSIQRDLASLVRLGKIKTKAQMDEWLEFYLAHPPEGAEPSAVKLATQTLKSIPDPKVFLAPGAVASDRKR